MYKTVKIGSKSIGAGLPCIVISEIGAMYEDMDGMKEMIKASVDAGADAVKIQTYKAETIAHPDAEFEFEDGSRMSQLEFFRKYEISEDGHRELMLFAKELDTIFFSTPSDYADVDFLEGLGVPAYKTGSDDLTNYPFLEYIAKKKKPMIVSTGMCTLGEVEEAVGTIMSTGNDQLILLHCTVSYPPKLEFANLNVIETLKQAFGFPVGYSNHIDNVFAPVIAATIGASVVEVHFTLDRTLKRQDYQVAFEPEELKTMIEQIRMIPILKGSGVKCISDPEKKWRRNGRKSLICARSMKTGELIQRKDIKIMRPGTGFHARDLSLLIGRTLKKDISENEIIPFDAF
jgi:N,N'-diacetyllegionaminate synthase